MFNPGAEIPGAPGDFVDRELRFAPFPIENRGLQSRAEFLVGVQRQYPLEPGQGCRVVFLIREASPLPKVKAGTVLQRDFTGSVGASGIDNDNFVGDSVQRRQQPRQILLFIQSDDADGEVIHDIRRGGKRGNYLTFPTLGNAAEFVQRRSADGHFALSDTLNVVLPTRNSVPSRSIAARTRASSK